MTGQGSRSFDPDLLRQVGQALYGERWMAPLCVALGVSDRTLRRWLIASAPVPEGVWTDLAEALGDGLVLLAEARLAVAGRVNAIDRLSDGWRVLKET